MVLLILYLLFQNICGWFYVKNDDIWYDFNNATTWHIGRYIIWWYYMIILYDNEMSWGQGDGYVVLRTPMDGPMIKAAYGETMIHSTEAVWEMLAQEEWLGCHHDASLMFDILESTLVWAPYMIFFCFHDIKIYMHYVLKSYMYYKRNTGGLWLRPGPTMFKEGFQPPMSFKEKKIHRYIVV